MPCRAGSAAALPHVPFPFFTHGLAGAGRLDGPTAGGAAKSGGVVPPAGKMFIVAPRASALALLCLWGATFLWGVLLLPCSLLTDGNRDRKSVGR